MEKVRYTNPDGSVVEIWKERGTAIGQDTTIGQDTRIGRGASIEQYITIGQGAEILPKTKVPSGLNGVTFNGLQGIQKGYQ